ncbi:MAG: NUDIX domain-containing protein [Bacteroidales bacterium]|nr:NUDIX domain-containing protein [Bacteroidales bacterium]
MTISYLDHTLTFNIAAYAPPSKGMIDGALDGLAVQDGDKVYPQQVTARELWQSLRQRYRFVKAAGGIVSDPESGKLLLIYRNGMWDLPKGHAEAGETLAATALRETTEETALEPLALGRMVAKQYHTYLRDGLWHLKQTTWFAMECRGASLDRRGAPQTDEGIEQLVWVAPQEWHCRLHDSFASLRLLADLYMACS